VGKVQDPIEYLVNRRFPLARVLRGQVAAGGSNSLSNRKLLDEVAAYHEELSRLPPAELASRHRSEQEKELIELRTKADREEKERFFNQPHAQADFSHWSKAAHWTLDEAVALSLGKAPERVTWEKVKPFVEVSALALQYQRRRDLALRALAWEQLFDPVLPGIFLAWAKRIDLGLPPELESAVVARGGQIADWKTLWEDLKSNFDEHHKRWMVLSGEQREQIDRLLGRISELEARLDTTSAPAPPVSAEKSLGTRERDSLLKLVIGMALGGYGYDPTAARSAQPATIASDLAVNGVPLDVDTVRKWLRAAAQLLPPKEDE
jgi:hypothetical protein